MAPILKMHELKYNDGQAEKTVYFLANPETYKEIKSATGVRLLDDDQQPDIPSNVEGILGSGVIVRAYIYYKAGAKRKVAQVLVPANKFLNFRRTQIGKSYRGGKISNIRQRRKATFY